MDLYYTLQKAQKGDEEAILKIIDKFKPTICKFKKKLNYEEAETDLIIILLETIKKIPMEKFYKRNDGIIINYIYFSLKNRSTKLFYKTIKKIKTIELDENIIVDTKIQSTDSSIFIYELIKKLSKIQREVIIYNILYGYTIVEISNMFHISRQAVHSAKNRGLKKLKNVLINEEY